MIYRAGNYCKLNTLALCKIKFGEQASVHVILFITRFAYSNEVINTCVSITMLLVIQCCIWLVYTQVIRTAIVCGCTHACISNSFLMIHPHVQEAL